MKRIHLFLVPLAAVLAACGKQETSTSGQAVPTTPPASQVSTAPASAPAPVATSSSAASSSAAHAKPEPTPAAAASAGTKLLFVTVLASGEG